MAPNSFLGFDLRRLIMRLAIHWRMASLFFSLAFLSSFSIVVSEEPVSFENEVVPILQTNCMGCHQIANPMGDYDLSSYIGLMKTGESGDRSVVPGNAAASYLFQKIRLDEQGGAEMPLDSAPLSAHDIELIRRWINEGATNDQDLARAIYSQTAPPVYHRLPVITAIDHSPDGKSLAVNGFNEVFLINIEDQLIRHRLIGRSSRIETVRFSPNGELIAVAGGVPGKFGEIQVWNVTTGKLTLSKSIGGDCVFGVSWSPDGKLLSFGMTDTTVRCISSVTGEQVLFQGAHNDWVRDTVFSIDGKRLVSVGRDTTCKLIEVATERFVDNLTSITPAILKGGIASVARHPTRDEVTIGCADGIVKVYRMDRQTKRVIGDDANLIRQMPAASGRIESVDVSRNGNRIVAASSLDGEGEIQIFSYEFDTSLSEDLKGILRKLPSTWNSAERKKMEDYWVKDVSVIANVQFDSGMYAVSFSEDGTTVAAGGADGLVRIVDTVTGKVINQFTPVAMTTQDSNLANDCQAFPALENESRTLPALDVESISVFPTSVRLDSPLDYTQLVVTAHLKNGQHVDITRRSKFEVDPALLSVDGSGMIQLSKDARVSCDRQTELFVGYCDNKTLVPVAINVPETFKVDFVGDVNPVLTRLGCNAGTCHGSQTGRNGFKLSLRGYDAVYDIRALTDEMSSRRVNLVRPDMSLMLAKPVAAVPHEGGQLFKKDDKYYQLLKNWIENGATFDPNAPRVSSIKIEPENPTLSNAGDNQQVRVVATYSDRTTRDVTREAFIEAGNLEVANIEGTRIVALRRGESPVLARYEGAFAATTATIMGDRSRFVWDEPEVFNAIDRHVIEKWKRMKIRPSRLCSDEEFLRRVHLDLTGLPPSPEQLQSFLNDSRNTRSKRKAIVNDLLGNNEFVEHWTNKWADLLQVNRKYLGAQGAKNYRVWIRDKVASNARYDDFVFDIITAAGSNYDNPAASYYKILRTPEDTMENTTHLFLGTRFNCNKCHDHPFERWTQNQYFETSAFFSQVKIEKDPRSGDKKIGGSAVDAAKPLFEKISDSDTGEMKHDLTGNIVAPKFPFHCNFDCQKESTRRERFASWLTAADNPYFATSYVNRLWGYLLGVGLIEPLDDIRAGNPPTNPELLDYLTDEFVNSGFDARHVLRLICESRVYQLSFRDNEYNRDDFTNYSRALPRRLSAEVLYDSIHFVTGSTTNIPGQKPGIRAAMLPDSGSRLPSGFLATLGRPNRESACECERSNELQLGSVLAMISGPDVSKAINDSENAIASMVTMQPDDGKLIDALYLRLLNRHATEHEINLGQAAFSQIEIDHDKLSADLKVQTDWFERQRPDLESERLIKIDQATRQLNEAVRIQMPDLLVKEAQQAEQIALAKKNLELHRPDDQTYFDSWRDRQINRLQWHPIQISKITAASGRSFELKADRSVLADNSVMKADVYTIESSTDLRGITGLRLEMLPDKALDADGPGTANNGNFVLNELELEIARIDAPNQWHQVSFRSARSFYDQPGYPIENIIDGKTEPAKGWACDGHAGKINWACLVTELPFGYTSGSRIRVRLHQKYDNQHQLGRFRISFTTYDGPISLSISEDLATEIAMPFKSLSKNRQQALLKLAERDDSRLIELKRELAVAKKSLEIPTDISRLRETLKRVSKPVAEDALLSQLKQDFEYSEKQLKQQRLTAAQDLTWALINSPEFLFNR